MNKGKSMKTEKNILRNHDRKNKRKRISSQTKNRWLYDVTESKRITLQKLELFIKGGGSITVYCTETGKDNTNEVLQRIIRNSKGYVSTKTLEINEILINKINKLQAEILYLTTSFAKKRKTF